MTRPPYYAQLPAVSYGAPWFADDDQAVTFLEHKGFTPEQEQILMGGIGPTSSGLWLGPDAMMRVSAAFACRRVIAEDVAKMPRFLRSVVYDREGRRRTRILRDHPVAKLLVQPNEWLTGMEFYEFMVGVATIHDGAYALITRDEAGRPLELLPLIPGAVAEDYEEPGNRYGILYRVTGYGETFLAAPNQLLKLHGPLKDNGLAGMALSAIARETLALAAQMEAAQARFHANDLRPSGILTTKATGTSPELRNEIRSQWQEWYGPGGRGGIAVLDNDFQFQAMNQNSTDSQVIENRRFQIEEVCRFFRVFPQAIGHNSVGGGYNSTEQYFNAHTEHTLHPWVKRLEEALERDLLLPHEVGQGLQVHIDMDAVKRGTLSDRVNAAEKAVKVYKTPNEIRAEEGLDPIPDPVMDRVQLQANNTGLQPRPDPAAKPKPRLSPRKPDNDDAPTIVERAARIFRGSRQ